MKIRLSKNNNHDGVSHGVECSQESDRDYYYYYYLTNIIIITEQMINLRSCAELLCQHRHRIQSQHKRIRERTRDGCDLTAFQRT